MMNLVIYPDLVSLHDYMTEWVTNNKKCSLVTPSPVEADSWRYFFEKNSSSTSVQVDSYFTFLKTLVEKHTSSSLEKYRRKADLIILMNKYLLGAGLEEMTWPQINLTYDTISELRSYTLDRQILFELLDFYPEEISAIGKMMIVGMNAEEVFDEHGLVAELSYFLKTEESLGDGESQSYVFQGFKFLNGHQVDLVKSLSIRSDVYIPIKKEVFDFDAKATWVNWISDGLVTKIELPVKPKTIPSIKANYFSPSQKKDIIFELINKKEFSQCLILKNQLDMNDYLEQPTSNIFIKNAVNIFQDALGAIKQKLNFILNTKKLLIKDLLIWSDSYLEEKRHPLEIKIFHEIKSILSLLDEVSEKPVSASLVESIFHVLELNLPRVSMIPLKKELSSLRLYSWRERGNLNRSESAIVLLSEASDFFKSNEKNYPKGLTEKLMLLGPTFNREWELNYDAQDLKEILKIQNSLLLIPLGIKEHSIEWKSFFEDFDIHLEELENNKDIIEQPNYFITHKCRSAQSTRISASRLQTYLECPQKYYFQYIEKFFPDVIDNESISPQSLGSLEHLVLKRFFEVNKNFKIDMDLLRKIATAELQQHCDEAKIKLKDYSISTSIDEIVAFCSNTFLFLSQLEQFIPSLSWNFEFQIQNGSIDLIGRKNDDIVLLDFKRTDSQIPNFSQWSEFKKIQLWYYLSHLEISEKTKILTGYLPMNDLSEVWLSGNMEIPDQELFKYRHDPLFYDKIKNYQKFQNDLIIRFNQEKSFLASPLNPEVCRYCPLLEICPQNQKGDIRAIS